MARATPAREPVREPDPIRKYRVLSRRWVHGKQGEIVELAFPADLERALLQGGVIERFTEAPKADRPLKSADKEG